MSETRLFETYEDEWKDLADELNVQVAKIPTISAKEREQHLAGVKERLQDAEDAVDGMRIACRGVENSSGMIRRLRVYEGELEDLKRELRNATHLVNPDARKLLLGEEEEEFDTGTKHKSLFSGGGGHGGHGDTVSLMESSEDIIFQATRDTIEMEDTATRVMEDLYEQRSAMERFKERLADINASLDKAGKLMQEMMKRICGNKFILYFVIFLLLGGIVVIIWLRFFPPWTTTTAPVTEPPINITTTTPATTTPSATTSPTK